MSRTPKPDLLDNLIQRTDNGFNGTEDDSLIGEDLPDEEDEDPEAFDEDAPAEPSRDPKSL